MTRSFAILLGTLALGAALPLAFPRSAVAQRGCHGCIPVQLTSDPAGAVVYLDSTDSPPLGTTPIRWARIPRGNHTLIYRLENYREHREVVDVSSRIRRRTIAVRLDPMGHIVITAGNEAANGAAVRIDGQPVGNVPYDAQLDPGRYMVQVGREGYVTFSQWVDLAGGQALTVPALLQAEAPRTGSLLVAGDVSGADILVDGEPRGQTPSVIENIPEGEHVIEVRPPADLHLEAHQETVRIIAGERARLVPTLRPVVTTGSLRVISNAPGAIVTLDGEGIGEVPATKNDVTPGEHIVEVQAEGFQPAQQPVTIEVGQQRVVSVVLEHVVAAPGRVVVNADTSGATVLVDGEERGQAPVVVEEIPAGTHAIIVRAQGYQEVRQTCNTAPGHDCVIDAHLEALGTPIRVEANVDGASFYLDGERLGPIPFEGNVPVGSHLAEVRADGYQTEQQQVNLELTQDRRVFSVELTPLPDEAAIRQAAEEEARRQRAREAMSFSASTLPDNLAVVDFYLGWPYIGGARLSVGFLDFMEAGLVVQTTGSGRITEFSGRVKAGWRPMRQVSLGAQLTVGGGIGPSLNPMTATNWPTGTALTAGPTPGNSFLVSTDLLASLHFSTKAAFTLYVGFDFNSDSYDRGGSGAGCSGGVDHRCLANPPAASATGYNPPRQNSARLRLQGFLEVAVTSHWNIFGSFGGIVAGNARRVMSDVYGLHHSEIMIYATAGATYKFGSL